MAQKRVLILVNHDVVIYNFRKELVQELIHRGYSVIISSPEGPGIAHLLEMGCIYEKTEINRHGKNLIQECKLLAAYNRLLKKYRPCIVLTYTIKPNIYGGLISGRYRVPVIANITGLGNAIVGSKAMECLVLIMYRIAFRSSICIFTQNSSNQEYLKKHHIYPGKLYQLPGSGVNLNEFHLLRYPKGEILRLAFISRVMKEKGIDEFLEMVKAISRERLPVEFHIYGFCEEDSYEVLLKDYEKQGYLKYHGRVQDVGRELEHIHGVILPSYHEGMSNVLLEAAASGRPLIATNIPGCREIIEDGETGYLVNVADADDLISKTKRLISLTDEERERMGILGRKKVEMEFDRQIVVDKYMNVIEELLSVLLANKA